MFYRESGQFKTSYQADQALFPIDVRLLEVEKAAEQRRDAHPPQLAATEPREKDPESAN